MQSTRLALTDDDRDRWKATGLTAVEVFRRGLERPGDTERHTQTEKRQAITDVRQAEIERQMTEMRAELADLRALVNDLKARTP